MTLTDLIRKLQEFKDEFGDAYVYVDQRGVTIELCQVYGEPGSQEVAVTAKGDMGGYSNVTVETVPTIDLSFSGSK